MECKAYRDLRVGIDPEIVVKLLHHLPQVGHPVLHGGGQDGLLGEGNEEERQIREVFRRHVTVLAPGGVWWQEGAARGYIIAMPDGLA